MYVRTSRVHTIDGTYVVHIPILVHTSSLERALNPANRRSHLTRSSFHRGLHKATSGEVRRCALYPSSSCLAVTADSYVYIIVALHTLVAASTRTCSAGKVSSVLCPSWLGSTASNHRSWACLTLYAPPIYDWVGQWPPCDRRKWVRNSKAHT